MKSVKSAEDIKELKHEYEELLKRPSLHKYHKDFQREIQYLQCVDSELIDIINNTYIFKGKQYESLVLARDSRRESDIIVFLLQANVYLLVDEDDIYRMCAIFTSRMRNTKSSTNHIQ